MGGGGVIPSRCYVPMTEKEEEAINTALEGCELWNWDVFELDGCSDGHPLQVREREGRERCGREIICAVRNIVQ